MPKPTDPIDAHLLRVFCNLMVEKSVSRTAIKLNQSQPSVSNALRRLREIFGDPLFSLDRGKFVATTRAHELYSTASNALSEIDKLMAAPATFHPAITRQTFRIGTPDFMSSSFLTRVVKTIRRDAPFATLTVSALGPDYDYQRALADGMLDIVISNWSSPPGNLHRSILIDDEIVCVVGIDHPFATNGITSADYLQAAHVVPMPYSPAQRGVVETYLASRNLSRQASVVLPFFNMALHLLPGTDLVFTTALHFAKQFEKTLPIAILPAPFDFPPMRFYQLWHERCHHSEAHKWLRQLMTRMASEVMQTTNSERLS